MHLLDQINRPEYIFKPSSILKRLTVFLNKNQNQFETVLLPWGLKLKVYTKESIGKSIWIIGVYDLTLTETLWRLTEPGDIVVDIGANIGYTTSIMAKRSGQKGRVFAFEPHPVIYKQLVENTMNWADNNKIGKTETYNIALSDKTEEGLLLETPDFSSNQGGSALISSENLIKTQKNNIGRAYTVKLVKLDEVLTNVDKIGLIKVDVEGHELKVLQGAHRLINENKVRDIVFEEHKKCPNETTQLLESYGYTIFSIWKGFWKPILNPVNEVSGHCHLYPPNYLATLDPTRAQNHLKNIGWHSLKG